MWLYFKNLTKDKIILSFVSILIFFFIYTFFKNEDFVGMPPTPIDGRLGMTDYFNRLYYSVVLQTAVGFGDIVGNTDGIRFISMLQAICMMIILIV
jgi:hypothetical protein